jgi:UDP-glucose 4-epimerase
MNTVLITGVAGMIGSHLLDALLRENVCVVGIDNLSYGKLDNIAHSLKNPNFKFYEADVRDLQAMRILGRDVDWIVHLAAVKKIGGEQSSRDTLTVNSQGTENILEVAKMWRCKMLFASTSDVYGMSSDLPFREDGDLLLGPSMIRRWSYAVSKLYDEQLCYSYHLDYNVPIVIVRYFGGFSHRASVLWSGGHIPIFVDAILNDREVLIHGDGLQTRSMSYVEDLIDGTLRCLNSTEAIGEVINLGNDEELSVIEAARLIHRLANTGKELKLKFVPMEGVLGKGYKDIQRRIPDLSKAKRILGYKPRYNMEAAIKIMLDALSQRATGSIGFPHDMAT